MFFMRFFTSSASLKELCVPRGMTVSLGKTLKNLGYPDIMTEENVYNLLNIDFGRLMRISGVYNTFPFFEEHHLHILKVFLLPLPAL